MSTIVLYESTTLAADVNKKAGNPTRFTFPDYAQVYVAIEAKEKYFEKLKKDPILLENVHNACRAQYTSLVDFFGKALKDINACEEDEADAAFKKAFDKKTLEPFFEQTVNNMVKATQVVVADYLKTQTDYKKYEFKVVAGITMTTAGIAVSIALIATSPFHFGAGTVIGIYGMVKSTSALIQMVTAGLQSVDEAVLEAAEIFDKVKRKIEKKGGLKKDVAKSVLNEFTEAFLTVKGFKDTLKNAAEKVELAKNKLNGMEIEWHKIGEKITRTLEKIDKIKAWHAEIEKEAAKVDRKPLEKFKYQPSELPKLEKKLSTLLTKNEEFQKRFKERKDVIDGLTKGLKELLANYKDEQKALKILEEVLKVVDIALAAGGASDWSGLADAAKDMVPAVGAIILDKAAATAAESGATKQISILEKDFRAKKA